MISVQDVLDTFGDDIAILRHESLTKEIDMATEGGAKFVKIGSLWRNKGQGKAALSGSLGGQGGARVYVFPREKSGENGPDYDLCIAPPAPPKDGAAPKKAFKDDAEEIPF